jgi:DNA-binding transcriptional regulator YhcF (GntR family)
MSMPKFPDLNHFTKEQAIDAIITSIAMEELALSHILNAEGEKIQFVLADKCADLQQVMEVNQSVSSLIDKIIDLQIILKSKLQLAKEFSLSCSGWHPDHPAHKPQKPCLDPYK